MKLGLTGKPNVGKSTLFQSATLKEIDIASYPFTTIEPNQGVAYLTKECPCSELGLEDKHDDFDKCRQGMRLIPVNLVDIAGLVPDASEGKGMGNEFLDSVREASALINVLDLSGTTNERGEKVEGKDYDIKQDVEFITEEFDNWLYSLLEDKFQQRLDNVDPVDYLVNKFSGLGFTREIVQQGLREKPDDLSRWSETDLTAFVREVRRLTKPLIYACNKADLPGAETKLELLRSEFPDKRFVPTSAEAELALRKATKKGIINYLPGSDSFSIQQDVSEERKEALEFIRENVLANFGSTGVQQVLNQAIFDLLDYIVVYPVENESKYSDKKGNVLPDAVLLKRGSTPLDLAYKIHSDIGQNYKKAINVRTDRTLGKDHELEDGDIVKIKV